MSRRSFDKAVGVATSAKLTHSTDEVRFSSLLQGEKIYSIPYFQRPYKWQSGKLRQLEADVLNLVDEQAEVHFLRRDHQLRSTEVELCTGLTDRRDRWPTAAYDHLPLRLRSRPRTDRSGRARRGKAPVPKIRCCTDRRQRVCGSNLRLHTSHEDRLALNVVVDDILQNADFEALLVGFTFLRLKAQHQMHQLAATETTCAARAFFKAPARPRGLERVSAGVRSISFGTHRRSIACKIRQFGRRSLTASTGAKPMTSGDLLHPKRHLRPRVREGPPPGREPPPKRLGCHSTRSLK